MPQTTHRRPRSSKPAPKRPRRAGHAVPGASSLPDAWLSALAPARPAATLQAAFAALARALRRRGLHAAVALFENGNHGAVLQCSTYHPAALQRALGQALVGFRFDLRAAPAAVARLARPGARASYLPDGSRLQGRLQARLAPAAQAWIRRHAQPAPLLLAPLYRNDSEIPQGVLAIAGDTLVRADLPAACACAEMLAMALERQRIQQMRLVSRVSHELVSVLNLEDLLARVGPLLEQRFGYSYAGLLLLDGDEIVTRGRALGPSGTPGRARLPESRTGVASGALVSWAARSRAPVLVPDASQDARCAPHPAVPDAHAEIVVPLVAAERLVGVLHICNNGPYSLDESDLEIMLALGGQLAVLAENAQLYREIEQRADEVSRLLVVAAAISTPLELEVRLEAIAHHARRLVNADGCILYRVDSGRGRVVPLVSMGPDGEPRLAKTLHLGEDLTGRVVARGLPEVADLGSECARAEGRCCAISVPLITGDETVGAMTLYREDDRREFGQRDVELLQSFAVQAALAIQNAELVETLRQRALSLQQAYDELAEARTTVQEAYQRAWLRQLLDEIAALSLSTLDVSELLERALGALLEWLGPSVGCISLSAEKPAAPASAPAAARGLNQAAWSAILARLPVPQDGADGGAESGEIRVDEGFGDALRAGLGAAHAPVEGLAGAQALALATLVLVPLKARGRRIGLVCMISTQSRGLTDSELSVVRLAADQLGLGLDNARLYQQVTEQNRALARVTKELESFTYSVSHDLKAPLRGIEGFTRALQEDYGDRLDDDGRHYLDMVRSAAVHLSALIDDLLAYSRLDRRSFALGAVDVHDVLARLLADRRYQIDTRCVDVRVDLPFAELWGEREGVGQLLANLIDNAIVYTRTRERPCIDIGGREDGREQVVWVKDNGIGFDMRYHDKIFEMFQRLHRAEEYPGTGVGLAIAKKIAERLRGRIWAESVEGEGATFYFALPRRAR